MGIFVIPISRTWEVPVLLIELDRRSPTPAYRQIRDRIVALVDDGTLGAGDRLPPTRVLAETVGVHRSTVVRAYDEIRALGYLDSRPGSYTTIRRRARPPATSIGAVPEHEPIIDWAGAARLSTGGRHLRSIADPSSTGGDELIDLERLAADPALAPAESLRSCLRHVMTSFGSEVLDYADPAGWPPLRTAIAARLRSHGIAVADDELLVTNGAQGAIDLVLRLLVRPGDAVAVEAPTYGMLHPLLSLHGVRPVEIPMTDDGIDLDRLEHALVRDSPPLVYTMPNFHNPTGITTDQMHRERLLELCERHRTPILEDGFEEEMKYFGRAVLPVKSIDRHGIVLYVGTFSKVVFPGFRVGWIAASREAIVRLTAIQHASNLAATTVAQAAAERFCRRGEFELYLRRIHRVYRRRMQAMLDGLEHHMPSGVRWTRPVGGYTLWLTLAEPVEAEDHLVRELLEAGVRVAPGRAFFDEPPHLAHLRLCIACVDEKRIEEGCRRLGAVMRHRRCCRGRNAFD
jgi:DNA-binding transcriptional MocR family regulator